MDSAHEVFVIVIVFVFVMPQIGSPCPQNQSLMPEGNARVPLVSKWAK